MRFINIVEDNLPELYYLFVGGKWKKEFIFQFIVLHEGNQDRNSARPGTGTKTVERDTVYWLALCDLLNLLSYIIQKTPVQR